MKQRWFYVASLLGFFVLVLNGAPPLPVLVGIGGVALINWRKNKLAAR